MSIVQITTDFAGQIGVIPRLVRVESTDDYAVATAAGYLNGVAGMGVQIAPTDFIFMSYSGGSGVFIPSLSGTNITLNPLPAYATNGPAVVGNLPAFES